MKKIHWQTINGTIYGTIPGRTVTLKIIFHNGWVEGCCVFDSTRPTDGWTHLVYANRFEKDQPNYFNPWKEDKTCNNEAGVELLQQHAEFLFRDN